MNLNLVELCSHLHLARPEGGELTRGLWKPGMQGQVRVVTVDLGLDGATFGAESVRVHVLEVTAEESHLLPSGYHHQHPIVRIKVAIFCNKSI